MLPAMMKIRSPYLDLVLTAVDLIPGRPEGYVARATRAGLKARSILGNVERLDVDSLDPRTVMWFHVDRGSPSAMVLSNLLDEPRPVMLYLLLRLADGSLWALAVAIPASDQQSLLQAIHLLNAIDHLTPPTSHDRVFGGVNAPQVPTVEPLIRQDFLRHAVDVYVELARQVPNISRYPFEISRGGGPMVPLVPVDRSHRWGTAAQLAARIAVDAPAVLAAGDDFVAAERGPDGLRLHWVSAAAMPDGDAERGVHQARVSVANRNARIFTTD